jgi:hypothetical protein
MPTKLLTKQEVAERLRCCQKSVDALRQRRINPIPHIKLGRILFPEDELEKWLAKQKRG